MQEAARKNARELHGSDTARDSPSERGRSVGDREGRKESERAGEGSESSKTQEFTILEGVMPRE
jgi:hypothetical protein